MFESLYEVKTRVLVPIEAVGGDGSSVLGLAAPEIPPRLDFSKFHRPFANEVEGVPYRDIERNVVLEDPAQDQPDVVYLVLVPFRLRAALLLIDVFIEFLLASTTPITRWMRTVDPAREVRR